MALFAFCSLNRILSEEEVVNDYSVRGTKKVARFSCGAKESVAQLCVVPEGTGHVPLYLGSRPGLNYAAATRLVHGFVPLFARTQSWHTDSEELLRAQLKAVPSTAPPAGI